MKPLNLPARLVLILLLIPASVIGQPAKHFADHKDDLIKIGMLIPDSNSIAAKNGAELAIDDFNKAGGPGGKQFFLVVKSLSGPWGTGSKQAVNLIFDDKVWALLSSHDGRNAHIVEQAATKSRVVMLSALTGDPTLSQAFVPWFFNSVPNFNQYAVALLSDIQRSGSTNYTIITDADYDSQSFLKSLLLQNTIKKWTDPVVISVENFKDPSVILDKINVQGSAGLVLSCNPANAIKIIREIDRVKSRVKTWAPLSIMNENELTTDDLALIVRNAAVLSPGWNMDAFQLFRDNYIHKYGKEPGYVAAASYDGMSILLTALRSAGVNDRQAIQKAMYNTNHHGVTGTIQFDAKGNLVKGNEMMKPLWTGIFSSAVTPVKR